jgi:hypothetical protein
VEEKLNESIQKPLNMLTPLLRTPVRADERSLEEDMPDFSRRRDTQLDTVEKKLDKEYTFLYLHLL